MSKTFTEQDMHDYGNYVANLNSAMLSPNFEKWCKERFEPTKKVAKTLEQLEKELTEAYKDNEDSYSRGYGHMYQSKIQELEDEIAALVKPTKKVIDLSVLIDSQIDCEFKGRNRSGAFINKLSRQGDPSMHYRYYDGDGDAWESCKPRMNHKHAWDGDKCPIAGFVVRAWLDKEDFVTIHTSDSIIDWNDVVYVEFLEVEHGYVMSWEVSDAKTT